MLIIGSGRCNMPHVERETYPRAKEGYKLEYVEVVSLLSTDCNSLVQLHMSFKDISIVSFL